jgi:ACT domain-containing protein
MLRLKFGEDTFLIIPIFKCEIDIPINMELAVVVVVGSDKPGIVAGISTELARNNVNIVDISQTVLRGVFSMIMIVDISNSSLKIGELRESLKNKGKELKVDVLLYHIDVFRYMERV